MAETEEEIPQQTGYRKYYVFFIIFFLILSSIVLGLMLASNQERKVTAHLKAIRAAGYPVTPAELDKWYPQVPANENAALILQNAFRYFVITGPDMQHVPICSSSAEVPDRTKSLPAEMQIAITKYLELNKEAIRLLHEAAALPKSRYSIDLSMGYMIALPHLAKIRQAVRLLALEGLMNADKGNSEAAGNDVLSILKISESLEQEPLFISQLVRIACQALLCANLETIMNRVSFSDSDLVKISKALEQADKSDGFVRGIIGERCLDYDAYMHPKIISSLPRTTGPSSSSPSLMSSVRPVLQTMYVLFYKNSGMMARDYGTFLDILSEYIDVCRTPFPKRFKVMDALTKKTKHLLEDTKKLPEFRPFLTLIPSFDHSVICDARNIASLRACRMAMAVERYRLVMGKLPDDAQALVPKYLTTLPIDPFDPYETPMRYAKLKKGYVVYSIGDDGKDNGGTEKNSLGVHFAPETDITFIVER